MTVDDDRILFGVWFGVCITVCVLYWLAVNVSLPISSGLFFIAVDC